MLLVAKPTNQHKQQPMPAERRIDVGSNRRRRRGHSSRSTSGRLLRMVSPQPCQTKAEGTSKSASEMRPMNHRLHSAIKPSPACTTDASSSISTTGGAHSTMSGTRGRTLFTNHTASPTASPTASTASATASSCRRTRPAPTTARAHLLTSPMASAMSSAMACPTWATVAAAASGRTYTASRPRPQRRWRRRSGKDEII